MAETPKTEETVVDNSVPYPEAPEVDYEDPNQQHYRGSRNPSLVKGKRVPVSFPGRAGNYPDRE